jgi:hypothetical protein
MISKVFNRVIFHNWKRIKYFEVPRIIHSEIEAIEKNKKEQSPIRILDIGAGSASYWNEPIFNTCKNLEIILLDASMDAYSSFPDSRHKFKREIGIVPSNLNQYADSEFDLVVALDLIEHLDKSEGYLLLYEIDRISSNSSLIFTPNGFSWQPPSLNNPYNAHISGWSPKELRDMGWTKQIGNTGWKFATSSYGLPKYKNKVLLAFMILSLPLSKLFPSLSFSFTAIKRTKSYRISEQKLS